MFWRMRNFLSCLHLLVLLGEGSLLFAGVLAFIPLADGWMDGLIGVWSRGVLYLPVCLRFERVVVNAGIARVMGIKNHGTRDTAFWIIHREVKSVNIHFLLLSQRTLQLLKVDVSFKFK